MSQNEDNRVDNAYNLQELAKSNPSDAEFYIKLKEKSDVHLMNLKKILNRTLQLRYTAGCVTAETMLLKNRIEKLNTTTESIVSTLNEQEQQEESSNENQP